MLDSLKIKKFRALEDFEVPKLGRVNLIVGKNNSGKSTVLEALRIYAANAQFTLLADLAGGHDESFMIRQADLDDPNAALPFADFFTGREYPVADGQAIEIGAVHSGDCLKIEHGFYTEVEVRVTDEDGATSYERRMKRVAKADRESASAEVLYHAIYVQRGERTNTMRFNINGKAGAATFSAPELPGTVPCSVVPTELVTTDNLSNDWDKIALTDSQNIVQEALRIILPDVEGIAFVRKDESDSVRKPAFSNGLTRIGKVRLKTHQRPVPLKSLGEGMTRVLQLVLKAFSAKGGFLLIDEFENGLHYSVQEAVWQLMFDLAQQLDIQIFATTHSWDCVSRFAKVAAARKDIEGILWKIGPSAANSDKGRIIATTYTEEELLDLTEANIEVR